MKRQIRFMAMMIGSSLSLFSFTASAQWSSGSGNVYLTASSDKVGIGTGSPAYKLDVDGDINLPFTSAFRIGGSPVLSCNSGGTILYLGLGAGLSSSGSGNSFLGNSAGANNSSGSANTFVGHAAGTGNTEGNFNTMLGSSAGFDNSASHFNTYIGAATGRYGTGSSNTTVGANALHNMQEGNNNTVMGSEAAAGDGTPGGGGSNNTVVGASAGAYLRDGWDNVYIGHGSGAVISVRDESYNTYVGSMTVGDGSMNTLMGYYARCTGTLSNAAAIGYNTVVSSSNTMVLGTGVGVVIGSSSRSNTAYKFEVNGDALAVGGVWATSDQRFKKNVRDYTNAMDVIGRLRPVKYFFRDDMYFENAKDAKGNKVRMDFPLEEQIGFLAQELEQVLPDVVRTGEDGYKAVNYTALIGLLTQGMKEQHKEVTALKEENLKLATALEMLTKRLETIEGVNGITAPQPADQKKNDAGRLEQNEPNPFTETTTLRYFVPAAAGTAKITIRSDKAAEIMSFTIREKGNGHVVISGSAMKPGVYQGELYIDGRLADTKKIVLIR